MANESILEHLVSAAQDAASALAPAAIGAAVGQAWEKGLSFGQRLLQWAVGICVSYYVGGGLAGWFHLDAFVLDAVKFMLGMIAFKATPRFISGGVAVAGGLPEQLRDRLLGPAKKEDGDAGL
jgi:hypothetical protein